MVLYERNAILKASNYDEGVRMISDIERTNIVVVGRWNRFILNPEWISKTLFETENLQVEFSFDLLLPPRYTSDSIRLTTLDDRIMITPLSYSNDSMLNAEKITLKLISLLPHTPLTAIGFNFGYQYDDFHINRIIEFKDTLDQSFDASYNKVSFKRSYNINDCVVNIEQTAAENNVNVDFNYHYNSTYFKNDLSKLEGKMIEFKSKSELIMKNTYQEECNDNE